MIDGIEIPLPADKEYEKYTAFEAWSLLADNIKHRKVNKIIKDFIERKHIKIGKTQMNDLLNEFLERPDKEDIVWRTRGQKVILKDRE